VQWAHTDDALGEHDAHTGRPTDTKEHGLSRPHIRHVATGERKQLLQISGSPSWARAAITPTRPQRPQIRRGRGAHAKHNAAPFSPRPLTTRSRPQPEHASASWWARQRPHNPMTPTRVRVLAVRPQWAQAGTESIEPRARSSATRRPTTGGAPPASTAGPSANATARSRATAAEVIVAATAAATCSTSNSGHATTTTAVIVSTRQDRQGSIAAASSCPAGHR
jgi:hypothetical protein